MDKSKDRTITEGLIDNALGKLGLPPMPKHINTDACTVPGSGKFIIIARVWGGVTGTRNGILKENGKVMRFDTLEEAESLAAHLTRERMSDPYRKANFEYTAGME